tara:strand:+ start:73 stop:396 length:324 start_codon:yes stop_codon:yes gene_type:complete
MRIRYYLSSVSVFKTVTERWILKMINSILLSSVLLFSGQPLDFPEIWKKIEGKWSYVGDVKEKTQILFWIEKKTKTPNTQILNKEIKKMPFITLSPKGEILNIDPLP